MRCPVYGGMLTIEWHLTNGIAGSNNASIGRIRTNARGFHDPQPSSP